MSRCRSEIKFSIPFHPVTKKNHQQIVSSGGRPFVIQSKQYREYEKAVVEFLKLIYRENPIDYPVNVKCIFYMPTNRIVDLVNLLAAIDDILVRAGVLEDDNYKILAGHDGSRREYDKNNPRTEITITRM